MPYITIIGKCPRCNRNCNIRRLVANPDTKYKNKVCYKCARQIKEIGKQNNNELNITINKARELVLDHYSRICACCEETEILFLEIDHVNNDGAQHRYNLAGMNVAIWAVIHNYPNTIQILCANCNKGKYRNCGVCPHKARIRLVSNE